MPENSKLQRCVVKLLDGDEFTEIFNVENTYGVILFDRVCSFLKVTEKDYFSLKYVHPKDKLSTWLNLRKTLKKQLKEGPYTFYFVVKFFPPDPCTLQEDLTRYLFVLAIRDLIFTGMLSCSTHYQLILSSQIVQAEFGDWTQKLSNEQYLKGLKFIPNQEDFEQRLVEYHKNNSGMTPEEAEVQFLKVAKDLDFYGMELHDIKDSSGTDHIMGVSFRGLVLFEESKEVFKIFWPELISVSFFKKNLSMKMLLPNGSNKTVTYKSTTRGSTKRLYRSIVEFHTFFRRPLPLPPVSGLSFSSKFRYNGRRTYLQIQDSLPKSMGISSDVDYSIQNRVRSDTLKISETNNTEVEVMERESFENRSQGECPAQSSDDEKIIQIDDSKITEYETHIFEAKFDSDGRLIRDSISYMVQRSDLAVKHQIPVNTSHDSTSTYLI
ncbi:Band 4.1-like protein 1 [Thelohanellus kitauei]|uniref:Band 4.1-like protein 1 n=1 Tax=Thelohanellus kitauei TaxID=669202 RepID=A0A0C2NCD0_THEKT|nr:Band 4.1-like protein 1 [Thelohanellus kitauei]